MKRLVTPIKRKSIAVMLILILLLPVVLTVTTVAAEAALADYFGEKGTAAKGLIMVLMAFLLERLVGDQKVDAKPGDPPVTDIPDGSYIPPHYLNRGEKEVLGFYVNWVTPGVESYPSLTRNSRNIDMVSPFWYTVTTNGSVTTKFDGYQAQTHSFIRKQGQQIIPLINNDKTNSIMFTDPNIRKKAVNNIVALVQRYNFDGVNIDFEFIPKWSRDDFTAFIRELSQRLHPLGKQLHVSVFPKIGVPEDINGAYDYGALANYADRIVMMAYDNHWSSGPSGPIAPLDWVEENIQFALRYIPANKLLLGIANYGYDWPTNGGKGTDIAEKKAVELAKRKGARVLWDSKGQVPYFYYTANNGVKHTVYFESSYSLEYKLQLVNKYNLQGIAIWRIGNEEDRFWEIVRDRLNK